MNSRPAIVGGFILGALALGVAGILFFGGGRLFATSTRVVVFFSESVAGLEVGAPVTYRGVRIGSVKSIAVRFSPDTMTAQIPVYLEFQSRQLILEGKNFGATPADFERLVKAGLRAQLALQSFVTGQLRVDLDFRPGTPVQLTGVGTDVPEIPAVPSDLNQLRNQLAGLPLREVAAAAQQTFISVGRLSDHLDAALDPLAKSALRTTAAATQAFQTVDDAVRQVKTDASSALHDLGSLINDAHGQFDVRNGELSRTLVATDRVARQAETLLDSLNGLVEPGAPFRSDLEASTRDLAVSTSHLRNFSETVDRNPNALLMGRTNR
ncbi:MlaD family protein [Paraburkholderia sp. Cpub6]|uniref:MlaD family protein n=1 Tax=Paraburkholderia sp. Cpub6 TaxID=2723094 RepID=UPI001615900D|nr:MlaD family protein [Paraburkholderia sp. Cpub6]MBB5462440.1 paraquat-inducible protein B [Paraburkholderia sp. Cpub6]